MKLDKSLISRIQHGLATAQDFNSVDIAEVIAAKSDPNVMQRRFFAEKAFGIERDKRKVLGVPHSTERTDRMGDVIKVSGWELGDFKNNPNLFFSHQTRTLPIALAQKVRTGQSESGMRALLIDEAYHDAELNPEAELVWKMVAAGALPGRSVGFISIESHHPETPEERKKLGLGAYGVLFRKQELIESSIVPVPANADALQGKGYEARIYKEAAAVVEKAIADGLISRSDAQRFIDRTPITEADAEKIERKQRRSFVAMEGVDLDAVIAAAQKLIDPSATELTSEEKDAEGLPLPEFDGQIERTSDAVADLADAAREASKCAQEALDELAAVQDENEQLRDQVSSLVRTVEALTNLKEERGARGAAQSEHRPNAESDKSSQLYDEIELLLDATVKGASERERGRQLSAEIKRQLRDSFTPQAAKE